MTRPGGQLAIALWLAAALAALLILPTLCCPSLVNQGERTPAKPLATAGELAVTPTPLPTPGPVLRATNRQVAGQAGLLAIYWTRLSPTSRQALLDAIIRDLEDAEQALLTQPGEIWTARQQAALWNMRTGLARYRNGDLGGLAQFTAGSAANAALWERWSTETKKEVGS